MFFFAYYICIFIYLYSLRLVILDTVYAEVSTCCMMFPLCLAKQLLVIVLQHEMTYRNT